MVKFDPKKISTVEKNKLLDQFYAIIASLNNKEDIKFFIKDLLSESEEIMLIRRLKIAEMLLSDKTYEEIRFLLGVGYGTIANVHKWIISGFGGYKKAIKIFKKIKK